MDRLCTGHVSVVGFLEGVRALLAGEPAPVVATPPPAMAAPPEPAPQMMRGSLDVMDLPALDPGHRHGRQDGPGWLSSLAAAPGTLEFEGGQLVHAEFGGESGEAAFTDLSVLFAGRGRGRLLLHARAARASGQSFRAPSTASVDRLLLRIAAGIDEGPRGFRDFRGGRARAHRERADLSHGKGAGRR